MTRPSGSTRTTPKGTISTPSQQVRRSPHPGVNGPFRGMLFALLAVVPFWGAVIYWAVTR